MFAFILSFLGLILLSLFIQIIKNMKVVGGNELGIISGKKSTKGFKYMSGGRVFIIPLINRFSKLDLTPYTIEVIVDSAIAAGIIPLNVKATVSFGIASNDSGRMRASTRILNIAKSKENLKSVASDIIEGHLRDAIASMTPEQVMKDKDTLVAKMINVCKNDLENIGLEITTMNIADVDDHRLPGVEEPDLYIALLKRVQTVNAETKAREAKAIANATAIQAKEQRLAETKVRALENEYEQLVASTKVSIQEQEQRKIVGVKKAEHDAMAKLAGLVSQIEATKQHVNMLDKKYEAEIVTPTLAEKEKMILKARSESVRIYSRAQAEIDELKQTMNIIKKGGSLGKDTYIIENFKKLIKPFAETLKMFPVKKISVIAGAEGNHGPISAIHPNAIDENKNNFIGDILESILNPELKEKIKSNVDSANPKGEDKKNK